MKKIVQSVAMILCVSFLFAGNVLAVDLGGLKTTANDAGFVEKDLLKIGGNALNVILSFVGVLFLLMMLAGGFLWMTAAGNEDRVKTALNLLIAGIIGLVIVVSAYAITAWLGDTLRW